MTAKRGVPKNHPDNIRCTAKAKQTGKRCKRPRHLPTDKCVIHGGASLKGPDAGTAVTLEYSKYLPTEAEARYLALREDPEMLRLKREIALIGTRLLEVVERLKQLPEHPVVWSWLKAAAKSLRVAWKADDVVEGARYLNNMESILEHGAEDWRIWKEIRALVQDRRVLVESERKRAVEASQILTNEQAYTLHAAIREIVLSEIQDPESRKRVADRFRKLVAG